MLILWLEWLFLYIATSTTTTTESTSTVTSTTISTTTEKITTVTESTQSSTVTESTTSASTSPSSTTEPTSTTSRTTCAGSEVFTCPNPNGLFPNPCDCSSFYSCSNGTPYLEVSRCYVNLKEIINLINFYVQSCPPGLVFNPIKGQCDYTANVPGC